MSTLVRRFRERLVLGHVVRYLDGDEEVLAWTHANVPGTRAPGVLIVTNHRLLLHVATSSVPDVSTPIRRLANFTLHRRNPEVVRVRLSGDDGDVEVELSLTHRVRSRSVGRVLAALVRHQVSAPDQIDWELTSPVPPMPRSARHHARRVVVTVAGVLVLLVSALFASPFFPGPGALTAVAGIAILAREYEWARDLHVWASRQADRFMTWMKRRWARRRGQAPEPEQEDDSRATGSQRARPDAAPGSGRVLEAEVPADGHRRHAGGDGGAVAS